MFKESDLTSVTLFEFSSSLQLLLGDCAPTKHNCSKIKKANLLDETLAENTTSLPMSLTHTVLSIATCTENILSSSNRDNLLVGKIIYNKCIHTEPTVLRRS